MQEVQRIKEISGKDIWLFGGSKLITSPMNLGLVDVVWLAIHPILLGRGKPLFYNIQKRVHLELIDTKTYSTGLISVTYHLQRNRTEAPQ